MSLIWKYKSHEKGGSWYLLPVAVATALLSVATVRMIRKSPGFPLIRVTVRDSDPASSLTLYESGKNPNTRAESEKRPMHVYSLHYSYYSAAE